MNLNIELLFLINICKTWEWDLIKPWADIEGWWKVLFQKEAPKAPPDLLYGSLTGAQKRIQLTWTTLSVSIWKIHSIFPTLDGI